MSGDEASAVEETYSALQDTYAIRRGVLDEKRIVPLVHNLQHATRCHMLSFFAFAAPAPLVQPLGSIPVDDIVSVFATQPYPSVIGTAYSAINEQSFHQQLGRAIYVLHIDPTKFIPGIVAYFKRKPGDLPVFAHLVFPALYGYFMISDFEPPLIAFLKQLIACDDHSLKRQCVSSFFATAVIFIQEFCRHFFKLLSAERVKPSVGQLLISVKQSLTRTSRFLSRAHLEIIRTFAAQAPTDFAESFFCGFLVHAVAGWAKTDLTHGAIEFSRPLFEGLCRGLSEDTTRKATVFNSVVACFCAPKESLYELWPIARNPYPLLLSTREELLLADIFQSVPAVESTLYSVEKLRDKVFRKPRTSLECFIFELYSKEGSNYRTVEFPEMQFAPSGAVATLENDEFATQLRSIQVQCHTLGLATLPVLLNGNELTDTFHEKLIKSQLVIDPNFKKYVLNWYRRQNVDLEQQFERYFERLDISEQLEMLREKMAAAARIFEMSFAAALKTFAVPFEEMIFLEQFVRAELSVQFAIEVNPDFQMCAKWKPQFTQALKIMAVDDKRLKHVQTTALANFDELSIGDRLVVLNEIIEDVRVLCGDNVEQMFGLVCNVLAGANCRFLYESLMVILIFLNDNKTLYKAVLEAKLFDGFIEAFRTNNLMGQLVELKGANGPLFSVMEKPALKFLLGLQGGK
jgi:hypothetical protein